MYCPQYISPNGANPAYVWPFHCTIVCVCSVIDCLYIYVHVYAYVYESVYQRSPDMIKHITVT